jgi:hypothetical protein
MGGTSGTVPSIGGRHLWYSTEYWRETVYNHLLVFVAGLFYIVRVYKINTLSPESDSQARMPLPIR